MDAITTCDSGFAMVRQAGSSQSSGNALGRTETQQSLLAQLSQPVGTPSNKRPSSPDSRKPRYADYPHKRRRPLSPGPRDRDRWDGPSKRCYESLEWDRDRDRDGPSSNPPRRMDRERDEDRGVVLPAVIHQFVGMLPPSKGFDGKVSLLRYLWKLLTTLAGPVFRTDDMLTIFRNAVIPSTSGRPRTPPPLPRGGKHCCLYISAPLINLFLLNRGPATTRL
jgi:cleavage stimulation factor subunit 3